MLHERMDLLDGGRKTTTKWIVELKPGTGATGSQGGSLAEADCNG